MERRTIVVVLALVAAAAGAIAFWRLRSDGDGGDGAIRAAIVERGTFTVAVTAAGRIEPAARVGLTFETPGRVAEVFVREGDQVERGAALARLETDRLELHLTQAEAALTSAAAQLLQVKAGARQGEVEQAEANLRAASAQLAAAVANRDRVARGPTEGELASARAAVAQAQAARKMAQDAYDRIEEEGTRKEQANYDLYTAKQELAAAEARLDDLISGPSGDQLRLAEANVAAAAAQRDAAQAQLEQLQSGPTKDDIGEAEAQVDQARVGVALAELSLEKAILRAPFSGFVSQVNLTTGELSPTRLPAIVMVDNSAFHMTIGVDELDVSRLREGQTAELTIEALPDAVVTGTVRSIAPIATGGGTVVTYDVRIDLGATDAPLRADMTANTTIVAEQLTDVLKMPTWLVGVDQDTGQPFVHRRVADKIERVDVALGARHEGVVQVLSGLSEGDEVVRIEENATFTFGSR